MNGSDRRRLIRIETMLDELHRDNKRRCDRRRLAEGRWSEAWLSAAYVLVAMAAISPVVWYLGKWMALWE